MKKLSKRETAILIIALGLGFVYAIGQIVVKPLRQGGENIDNQLRLNQARLMKARQMAGRKNDIEQRYQHLIQLIGATGSESSEMSGMVARIEAAAAQADVHIVNMQPQKVVNGQGKSFFPVELQVDGQWANIVKFIHLAQSQPNYYFINELSLEKYSDNQSLLRGRIVLSRMRLINP
ncbi:MAG: type 4a pilus biogenesis protein PilO [Candidatus Omnitrophica bacterium]|nr:type 4a pilus biogenesis protein PilO [Candidatus Omnitrophota bacterium]